MSRIQKALNSADETRGLLLGKGVIAQLATFFEEEFANQKAIIVTDINIYKIIGESISQQLRDAGIEQEQPFVYQEENLYAEYGYVDQLIANLKTHKAIPIAVGSGTINDLVKLASYKADRRYMCVGTAASMDGYTAFGASITANGAKQTFNCPAPLACLADIEIMSKAPADMTASGYADLFAKTTAGADWIVADMLGVEPMDEQSWDIVQGNLRKSLSNPQGIRNVEESAMTDLVEGLILGGFAMQAHKTSRPASGAEHQFSHLWNMEHHTNKGEQISHGFQVAIGTLAITAFYEAMLSTSADEIDIEKCCELWPTEEELAVEALEIFKNTDFPQIGYQETKAKYISKEELAVQLQLLKTCWEPLKVRIREQLFTYEEVKKCFEQVGAPSKPEDISVSRAYLKETFIRAQYIRRRFTILDVALRTNLLDKWLDKLFGKNGIWEIKKEKAETH